jgi:hypothetical protein
MRQYIIKQLHARVMNADDTANLEYPTWKRRTIMVGAFVALRMWSLVTIAMIPFVILFAIGLYTCKAIKEIAVESFLYVGRDTLGANYRNLISDVRGLRNIWKGEYGRGKLIVRNPAGDGLVSLAKEL